MNATNPRCPRLATIQSTPRAFKSARQNVLTDQRRCSRKSNVIVYAAEDRILKVVITGSTKGLGKALAKNFLEAGDSVIISSRSDARVQSATRELDSSKSPNSLLKGLSCNVSKAGDVAALAAFAKEQLGSIDIWINNAGTNSYKFDMLSNLGENDIINIIETNVLGVMFCCREAMRTMRQQSSVGHIFNMDGAGATGNPTPRFAAYGASKRGLEQLGKSLQAELKMEGVKNVCVHNLSPGMVTTELLMAGNDTPTAKFFINCLAESPETVADELVPKVRRVALDMKAPGSAKSQYIRYLTRVKAFSQIFGRYFFGQRKNRYVSEEQGADA